MSLKELDKLAAGFKSTDAMPVLFVGHGSPMNAIETNEFTAGWQRTAVDMPAPAAVLCISAHWETKGTYVTAMEKPRTIHDFGGFPKALFDVQYPAPGSPVLAAETRAAVHKTSVGLDEDWGLDHGCWSVLTHLYPQADMPVVQMSLDYRLGPLAHYELARELAALRRKGILIIGSGNMVHNLRMVNFEMPDRGFDWAEEANEKLKKLILAHDNRELINYKALGREIILAAPTPEHYLPLLYILALREENEQATLFNDKTVYGSISMTSLRIGKE